MGKRKTSKKASKSKTKATKTDPRKPNSKAVAKETAKKEARVKTKVKAKDNAKIMDKNKIESEAKAKVMTKSKSSSSDTIKPESKKIILSTGQEVGKPLSTETKNQPRTDKNVKAAKKHEEVDGTDTAEVEITPKERKKAGSRMDRLTVIRVRHEGMKREIDQIREDLEVEVEETEETEE